MLAFDLLLLTPKNFYKSRIWPIAGSLGIPKKLVSFQVMRRTVGTDLQDYGTMKDAQAALRRKSLRTTGDVYMQPIPDKVVAALEARTRDIFRMSDKGTRSRKKPALTEKTAKSRGKIATYC
jgi:hypothetical protein